MKQTGQIMQTMHKTLTNLQPFSFHHDNDNDNIALSSQFTT
jgi:hypothetical protein